MSGVSRGLALASAIVMAGCSSQATNPSTNRPSASTAGASHRLTLSGSITVTGDFKISGPFTAAAEQMDTGPLPTAASPNATCAGYARGLGDGTAFVSPEIHTAGNPNVYFRAMVSPGYSGAGTYSTQSTPGLSGVAAVSIVESQGPVVQVYTTRHGGTTTLTVAPDGSGTLTFTKWGTDETRQGHIAGYLYGNVQWTCR